MNKIFIFVATIGLICNSLFSLKPVSIEAKNMIASAPPIVPEAPDYATQTWGDAWDMSQFNDIANYLNQAGHKAFLTNIQVADGIFSATSTSLGFPYFMPLFPGYLNPVYPNSPDTIANEHLGNNRPINPASYQCLYMAVKVDPVQVTTQAYDTFSVVWYKDVTMAPYGTSPNGGIWATAPAKGFWQIMKIDLSYTGSNSVQSPIPGSKPWLSYTKGWQGLQIIPTQKSGIHFAFDWIRLTPCAGSSDYAVKLTWNQTSAISNIWIKPDGYNWWINTNVAVTASQTSASFDTRGLPSGKYEAGLGTATTCCNVNADQQFVVNQSPIASFQRPAPDSGQSFTSSSGLPWEMANSSSITKISCATSSINNGSLLLDTPAPQYEPSECKGNSDGESDPQIFLNFPPGSLTNAGQYRYLTFRMKMDGDVPHPTDGMIVRWLWGTDLKCVMASEAIALNLGWNTYVVDLWNPNYGIPVTTPPNCSMIPWKNLTTPMVLRLDPNENWTGNVNTFGVPAMTFHQEIDYIRLVKEDAVSAGSVFPVSLTLNKPASSIQNWNFYYTTDLKNTHQNVAQAYHLVLNNQSGPFSSFLPAVMSVSTVVPQTPQSYLFQWDTSSVQQTGEYYICADANDGYNTGQFCSQAPVLVTRK